VCGPASGGGDGAGGGGSRLFGGIASGGVTPFDLVPIDHGFCLPEALEPPYFEWLHWPQAMLPFEQAELDYVAALDVGADVELLRTELPALRPQCLRVLQVRRCVLCPVCWVALGWDSLGGLTLGCGAVADALADTAWSDHTTCYHRLAQCSCSAVQQLV